MTTILIMVVISLLILKFNQDKQKKELLLKNKELSEYKEELFRKNNLLRDQNKALETRMAGLSKYEEMKATKESIEKEGKEILDEAFTILVESKDEANEILKKAREKSRELKISSEGSIDAALKRAKEIENLAKHKAKEIAGAAYEAKENAELYENIVKAMKNKISGYGDEYLRPTHSLLDDLSEEYGFIEIGKELKKEREIIKAMASGGIASSCEYVEKNRSKTATEFVLDAFNGKVESVLSRVKHDNYGKLEQEIKDAYTLVNYNGKAFRNAKIEEEYLNARLKELELAVKLYAYKEEEKEEQKRIREEIREEEKARKEHEKAIKEAEAEEKRNLKALEQAQKEYEKIMSTKSEEEKQKYALRIAELEKQLEEAHKLKERVVSQAQLTRSGHVYIISNVGSFGENVYKIGMTRRLEPLDRVKELGDASVPFPFDVHAMIYSEDAPGLEKMIHREFNDRSTNLVNMRKEFFNVNLEEVEKFVKGNYGEFKITKLAEADQYRQTLEMRNHKIIPIYSEAEEELEEAI